MTENSQRQQSSSSSSNGDQRQQQSSSSSSRPAGQSRFMHFLMSREFRAGFLFVVSTILLFIGLPFYLLLIAQNVFADFGLTYWQALLLTTAPIMATTVVWLLTGDSRR